MASLSGSVFTVLQREGSARRGALRTAHGLVQTPAFMPVGTHATVKACHPDEVAATGAEMILGNFYHLSLRPGLDLIAKMGGLHSFMSWPGSILTDSGGYQMVSLSRLLEFDDEGVTFRSPYDGGKVRMTPESVIAGQVRIGVDVAMALDHPSAFGAAEEQIRDATRRTHLWAARCREVASGPTLVFGIVQGGFEPALRRASAATVARMGFDGLAIGGLVLGEPAPIRHAAIEACVDAVPEGLPRYLMGLGSDVELLDAVTQGIDMFDCVLPTRLARTGTAMTRHGRLVLRRSVFRDDDRPLEVGCDCPACARFSRAYLRHLYQSGEILGHRMVSLHNLHHLGRLMAEVRVALETGAFPEVVARRRADLAVGGAVASGSAGHIPPEP
ncbi:MAG TPA: tRNA guanosine(34) transglycosylase Tgt [Candidatus Dormibacteraeota bacterium]|nr:tRNA guanosine(34) transglycosylase Tgt [Candidatus Dormibacteraeota bacterium]